MVLILLLNLIVMLYFYYAYCCYKVKNSIRLYAAKLSEQCLASAFAFDAAVVGVVPLLAKQG